MVFVLVVLLLIYCHSVLPDYYFQNHHCIWVGIFFHALLRFPPAAAANTISYSGRQYSTVQCGGLTLGWNPAGTGSRRKIRKKACFSLIIDFKFHLHFSQKFPCNWKPSPRLTIILETTLTSRHCHYVLPTHNLQLIRQMCMQGDLMNCKQLQKLNL